jgi:hypothetical protein
MTYDIQEIRGSPQGLLKQYELLASLYDNEMSRFWVRFNIFVGMEFVGLIALIVNAEFLVANPGLMRALLLFCALFSGLVVLIVLRSISSARLLLTLLSRIEANSDDLAQLLSVTKRLDPLPQYINFLIALAIAALFSMLWWSGFVLYGCGVYLLRVPT